MHETLRSLDPMINDMREFIERKTDIAKKQLYQRSFPSLPDEVLATVFEFSLEDPRTCYNISRMPMSLSHVSRRFRRLALKLPRLWRTVSTTQSYAATWHFLKRAGKYKLSVVVRYDNGYSGSPATINCDIENFFNMVCPLYRDWSEFTLCLSFLNEDERDTELTEDFEAFIDLCNEHLKFDEMPSLYSATYDFTPAANDVFCEIGSSVLKWWRWRMPNIRIVGLFGAHHASFGNALTSLTIDHGDGDDGYISAIIATIEINHGIEELNVSLLNYEKEAKTLHPQTKLEKLKKFTFRAREAPAYALLSSLNMPALTQLQMKVLVPYGFRFPSNWLECATRRSDYRSLESFSLDIERTEFAPTSDTPDLIGPALSRFENLKHLRLSVPNTPPPPLSSWKDKVPYLQSLELENCDQFGQTFLEALKHKLGHMGAIKRLKTLEVRSCAMLSSEEMVREIFPDAKIVFEKYEGKLPRRPIIIYGAQLNFQ